MKIEDKGIRLILLDWVRLYYSIENNIYNRKALIVKLKDIEKTLKEYKITDLIVFDKSQIYYTLTYLIDGKPNVMQFPTEEVEFNI